MLAGKLSAVSLLGCVGFVLLGGCPTGGGGGGRLCNQPGPGCSNIIIAWAKVVANQLDTLNPDDVQVLSDTATELSGANFPPLTDAQAQAVVNVMHDNNIRTIADLQVLIARAQIDPGSVNISWEDLFILTQIASLDLG